MAGTVVSVSGLSVLVGQSVWWVSVSVGEWVPASWSVCQWVWLCVGGWVCVSVSVPVGVWVSVGGSVGQLLGHCQWVCQWVDHCQWMSVCQWVGLWWWVSVGGWAFVSMGGSACPWVGAVLVCVGG